MNNELTAMHEIAMEFVDEARIAKQRGDLRTTRLFFQKALNLEKIVAINTPEGEDYQLSRSVFFRSAASLAIHSFQYEEALQLVELAMRTEAHPAIVPALKELSEKAKHQQSLAAEVREITGLLVAADIPSHQIKLQMEENNEFLSIEVPEELLSEIVKSYWKEKITVKSIVHMDGSALFKGVQLAA
ncbi:MAG: hypothetical protein AAGI49_14255 [Bacteroidota bacterium]